MSQEANFWARVLELAQKQSKKIHMIILFQELG